MTRADTGESCATHELILCTRTVIDLATNASLTTTQTFAVDAAGGLNVERMLGHLSSPLVSMRAHLLFSPSACGNASLFFLQAVHTALRTHLSRSINMLTTRATCATRDAR